MCLFKNKKARRGRGGGGGPGGPGRKRTGCIQMRHYTRRQWRGSHPPPPSIPKQRAVAATQDSPSPAQSRVLPPRPAPRVAMPSRGPAWGGQRWWGGWGAGHACPLVCAWRPPTVTDPQVPSGSLLHRARFTAGPSPAPAPTPAPAPAPSPSPSDGPTSPGALPASGSTVAPPPRPVPLALSQLAAGAGAATGTRPGAGTTTGRWGLGALGLPCR